MGGYALIAENIISEIKYRIDIEQLIGGYVQLKKRGTTLVGLCPFHSEKTPSFTVWPQDGHYHCFGCGAGGDIITFIRQIENLEYPEAVEFLAKRAGVEIPKSVFEQDNSKQKLRILELNRFAARWFHERLFTQEGAAGLAYLKKRRLSDKTIKRFGLGFAPAGWDNLRKAANAAGFSDNELAGAFLVSKKNETVDMFRNRVMYPIIDSTGGIIGFGGRVLDDSLPKYINSSDTVVFKKSRNLFALNFAKKAKAGHLILAEGYMDVIMLHQAGFTEAVATLGTALTQEQARLMARHTDKVIIAYDSDKAGTSATQRAYEILREAGLSARVLEMKDAKDPDEYIKKFGADRFAALLEGSADALSFKLRAIKTKYDLDLPEEKTACLKETASELANLESDVETDVYAAKAAEDLNADKKALLSEIVRLRRSKAKRRQQEELRRSGLPASVLAKPGAESKFDAVCSGIIRYLFDNPADCGRVCTLLPFQKLPDPFWDSVLDYVKSRAPEGAIDISPLGEKFTVEQMGKLSKMLSGPASCTDMNTVGKYTDKLKLDLPIDLNDEKQLLERLNDLQKIKGGKNQNNV
ncbi:MAG TPA: DNA primase [Oscillospiraceae bacterium]|nr:DNA primase [Oscillospiraceae bacterium]HPS33781.1 DNA primase [Oscillospiraceae bacterium]